jgi:hypothetical protein
MGHHWVYVLKNISCTNYDSDDSYDSDGYARTFNYYVGETKRLYTRFNEHITGRGGKNTQDFDDVTLVGLYNVVNNDCFMEYRNRLLFEKEHKCGDFSINAWTFKDWKEKDASQCDRLCVENRITERCMILFKDNEFCTVAGGKYTKHNSVFNYDATDLTCIEDRPICKCGLPAEVFLSKKNEIWFKCAIANAGWVSYDHPNFTVADSCDFIQKFTEDKEYQDRYKGFKSNKNSEYVLNVPKLLHKYGSENNWNQHKPCVICDKKRYTPVFNNGYRQLCTHCVYDRWEDIKRYKHDCTKVWLFIDDDDDDDDKAS